MGYKMMTMALLAAAILMIAGCGAGDVEVTQEFLYEQAAFPQCHAATIVEYPEGCLTAAFFGGPYEGNDDVCIYLCRKKIGDDTWSEPVVVAEDSLHACWNPVLFAPGDGRLLLFYKTGPEVAKWTGHVRTSYDGGGTWTGDYEFPQGMLGAIKNKPVTLASGRIVSPSSEESYAGTKDRRIWTVHFEISDDGAHSWRKVGPVEADDSLMVIQPTVLQHKDGTLQALCRSANGSVMMTWSHDGGDSWSKMEPSNVPNNNSGIDAVTLPDGRFVLVANPIGDSGKRYPLCVLVSEDGINWENVCTLASEPVESGYCYPSVIYGSDGALHVVYTWDRKKIRYARVVLPSSGRSRGF